jgi:3-oxoacyl-[acyl-carrier protein] reductase
MELNIHGKRVLITGSSRGIGLAIARAFLAEGAAVFLTSRNPADLELLRNNLAMEFASEALFAGACDFTDVQQIKQLKNYLMKNWDGLDALILNAGSGKSVADPIPSQENFASIMQLNFAAAVNTTREFYSLIRESRGNIIFIASIAGLEAFGAPVDYAVAKSAIIAFAKNLARKVAVDGVRVNCVAPGNIYFKGGSWDEKMTAAPERIMKRIEAAVPMRRFGRPEEIADAVIFLASERSSFTTGACLIVDGGQTVGVF